MAWTLAPYADNSDHFIAKYAVFREWPEFSGDDSYPVPCPDDIEFCDAVDIFDNTGGKDYYRGEYGAARVRLLYFIIDHLTAKGVQS